MYKRQLEDDGGNGIFVQDLKPENMVIKPELPLIRIIDWGFAKQVNNYKNVVKWVKAELVKCNAGLSDKMFTSNPQSCPMRHANNFASGMNNACRGQNGVFADMKNAHDTKQRLCRLSTSYTNDADVGYVNWSTRSAKEIRLSSCWKTPCSNTDNHQEIIIDVTQ